MLHSNFSSHTHVGEIQKHLKSQDAVGEYMKRCSISFMADPAGSDTLF